MMLKIKINTQNKHWLQEMNKKLHDEPARQASLKRYNIMDTPPEESFDKIVQMVVDKLQVPVGLVSFLDQNRMWFKSSLGVDFKSTDKSMSFCQHAIKGTEPFVVEDATKNPLVKDSPLVTGKAHNAYIRSYLGVPITMPDGYNIGALCAIDFIPRHFTDEEISWMKNIRDMVVEEIELRQRATCDDLTGMFTRRTFLEILNNKLNSWKIEKGTIMIFDIDGMTEINEKHGYTVGNAVIRDAAHAIQSKRTDGMQFARLGGDEFAVFIEGKNLQESKYCADLFRDTLKNLPAFSEYSISLTATFGAAELQRGINDAKIWLSQSYDTLVRNKTQKYN